MKIAVIGAGASGMAAALQAAWNGANVTLFERNAEVGRKLLVTGSGRCNITNDAVAPKKYTCADPNWMAVLLSQFGVNDLVSMLAQICVPVHKTSDGWYYPLSESAHTVVQAFSSALEIAGVALSSSCQVTSIHTKKNGFVLQYTHEGEAQEKLFERVIVSAGGMAYPSLGSRGELFPVLASLGQTVLPKRPALAPLILDMGKFKALQGVRLDVGVTLWDGSRKLASAAGNLIFTQWGLNGPAVMDISHHVSARPDASLELSLNLLALFRNEFDQILAQKRNSRLPLRVFLGAFFPPKVISTYLKISHLPGEATLDNVGDDELNRLTRILKDTRLPVKGVRGFEYCQVSAGGVPVNEVDPRTLESRLVKGLYLTGETLDVVGPCGGYNLHFAFSSGAMAGKTAAGQALSSA
ncbi:MAG: aminoacetone oxidase family FAD-binding enzyme [Anaerolineales bacterium]|nr:aminoacetone oxidase family FAD-binding enzyme [Anaerolineales bacterium]